MDKTQYNKTAKDLIVVVLKYAVVVGALSYLMLSSKLQWRYLWVTTGGYHLVALAVCLQLLVLLLSFVRYKLLLRGVGLHIGLSDVIAIGFIGSFFGTFMFGNVGGDMAKLTYVIRKTGKRVEASTSVIVDRLLGLLGLFVLGAIAIFLNWPEVAATADLHSLSLVLVGVLFGTGLSGFVSLVALIKGRGSALIVWLGVVGVITVAAILGWQGDKLEFFGTKGTAEVLQGRMLLVLLFGCLVSLWCCILVPALVTGGRIEEFCIKHIKLGDRAMTFIHSVLAYRNHFTSLLSAVTISVFIQFIALISLYLFSQALQLERTPTLGHIFFAAPLAIATNNLPLPGSGLGVGESAFDQLLSRCRTVAHKSIQGGAGIFLLARCWGIVLGLIGLPFYLRGKKSKLKITEV